MAFAPAVPVQGIQDFIHAVSFLECCKRADPLSKSPIGQRSKELRAAKMVALKALNALVGSNDNSLFKELERHLECLLVSPRINNCLPRYPIAPHLNDTVWASHVLDDFLFIGPGSEFMQVKVGLRNAFDPKTHDQRHRVICQFIESHNIRFILNVSKELIPGLQTDGQRDYPVHFSEGHPITCVKMDDLIGIQNENLTLPDSQAFMGVMVPMDDSEEYTPEFEQLVQVAAFALELAWRRYVLACVHFPSHPPPRAFLHCFGGLNRSTFTAVVWLVKYHGISPDHAWNCMLDRRRPQCKEERPPLNGIVNGKFTGKMQWRDALKRMHDPSILWPQMQLSQAVSQPLFSPKDNISYNIINTAQYSARALYSTKLLEAGVVMGFNTSLSQILCGPHPVFDSMKQDNLQIMQSSLHRSTSSSSHWPVVPNAPTASQSADGRLPRSSSSSRWDSQASSASGSQVKESVSRVNAGDACDVCTSSNSDSTQCHYLRVLGLNCSVSDNDVFLFFQKYSASRDHIVSIKSSTSQTQLTFVGFRSMQDALRARDDLFEGRPTMRPRTLCGCHPVSVDDTIVSEHRLNVIKHNGSVQSTHSSTDVHATTPRKDRPDTTRTVAGCAAFEGSIIVDAGSSANTSKPQDREIHSAQSERRGSDAVALTGDKRKAERSRSSLIPCRYFARGHCDKGVYCPFNHDRGQVTKETEVRSQCPHSIPENVSTKHEQGGFRNSSVDKKVHVRYVKLTGFDFKMSKRDIMALLHLHFPGIILSDNDVVKYVSRDGLSGSAYCSISITEENFSALLRRKLKLGSQHIHVFESFRDRFIEVSTCGRSESSEAATATLLKQEVVSRGSTTTIYASAALISPSSLTSSSTTTSILDAGTKRMRESHKAPSDLHVTERESKLLKSSWGTPTTCLFIKNLPHGCYATKISSIFKHLQGFRRARDSFIKHASINKPVVFVEFDTVSNSKTAIIEMQGRPVFDHSNQSLEILFARSGNIHDSVSEQTDAVAQDLRNGISQSHREMDLTEISEPSLAQTSHKHQHYKEEDLNRNIHIRSDSREPHHEQNASASRDHLIAREASIHCHSSGVAASSRERTPRRISSVKLFDAEEVIRAAQSYLEDNRHTSVQSPVLLARLGEHSAVKESMVGATDSKLSLGLILKSKPDIFGFCGHAGTTAVYLIAKSFHTPNLSRPSGGQPAPVLYRSPSGRTTRTWCRFDRLCKSGNNCNFGHEIIEIALSAQKSSRLATQDIRQSIDSKATPNATSLESLEISRREEIGRRNEAAAVETSPSSSITAEDSRIDVSKRQKTVVDLRSELATLRVPMS